MSEHMWGINWQKYHQDRDDLPHIERMGYRSFTIYEWHWSNKDACRDLIAVARDDAIFLDRDHPLSEQKDDQWRNDPALKGRNHADEWAQKVREGKVYTPLDRTYFLGLNEPDSHQFQRQIDAYNEAYCRRMAEHGLRAAAYSFGVGQPSTKNLDPKEKPDWSWYAASAEAVLEGGHIVATHEYGAPQMGGYGWEYWCNRISFCPYPFDVIFDECGIDNGVLQSRQLYGWAKYLKPEEYLAWLDGFQMGMAQRAPTRKVKLLSYNIFSFDHGSGKDKDWHSFDIRPLRPLLEAFQWSAAATPTQPAPLDGPTATPSTPAGANIRSGPGRSHPKLGAVARGIPMQVTGRNAERSWYRVESFLGTGWVSATVVDVSQVGDVPVIEVDPAPAPTPTPAPQPAGDKWQRSIAFVRRWEGGWANDPNDPGGATNKGITISTYTRWRKAHGQPQPTVEELRNLSDEEADQILFEWYWKASGADLMPWPLCLAMVDLAVNGGVERAEQAFGEAGPTFINFMAWRIDWYTRINNFEHFGKAWIRRCADLMKEAVK